MSRDPSVDQSNATTTNSAGQSGSQTVTLTHECTRKYDVVSIWGTEQRQQQQQNTDTDTQTNTHTHTQTQTQTHTHTLTHTHTHLSLIHI